MKKVVEAESIFYLTKVKQLMVALKTHRILILMQIAKSPAFSQMKHRTKIIFEVSTLDCLFSHLSVSKSRPTEFLLRMYANKTLVDLGPGRTGTNCNTFNILTKNNLGEIAQISVEFLHGLEREIKPGDISSSVFLFCL